MKCPLCNGELLEYVGNLPFGSNMLGEISVPGIAYSTCSRCEDITIGYDESGKITDYIREEERRALNEVPIGEFVSLNEAANLLEMTKQAFNKKPRIQRGFVYAVSLGGRKYYHRASVLMFKENGKDGRLLLTKKKEISTEAIAPVVCPVFMFPSNTYGPGYREGSESWSSSNGGHFRS